MNKIETTNALNYSIAKTFGNKRIKVKIRLDDCCNNGHEDFSITAEIAEHTPKGWREYMAGCCHDEILTRFPEFAPFVALHLSDWEGSPMYAMANGFYHFQNKTKSAQEYIRATDEEFAAIIAAQPRTEKEFSYLLETMGFRAKWRKEAKAATRQLEKLTGNKFKSKATRQQWVKLSAAEVKEIKDREASGYYTPEAIAKRDADKAAEVKAKLIAEIEEDHAKTVEKSNNKRLVKLYFAERGIDDCNVIFYDHTNQIVFNWNSGIYTKKWSQEEFVDFMNEVDYSALPAGVEFKLDNR